MVVSGKLNDFLRFKMAIEDFRYLLDREYDRESALKFIGDHYQLNKQLRLVLYRCVYGFKKALEHKEKKVCKQDIHERRIGIDGYNVLITVESLIQGKLVIFCDDYFVRDVSAVHGKHRITPVTLEALKLIAKTLKNLKPEDAGLFFDSQVSYSGRLALLARKIFLDEGLKGEFLAVKQADNQVLNYGGIAVSSDTVIIDKAEKIFDLSEEVVRMWKLTKLLNLKKASHIREIYKILHV
ncbi:MAG: DUF434 domain-containing protein [Candidatus Bathyarchaeota archaeon]